MLNGSPYLTRKEVAAVLRVSYHTLKSWRDNGTLPAVKLGKAVRYRKEDIEAKLNPNPALINLENIKMSQKKALDIIRESAMKAYIKDTDV
jgi:excisionase family DNA binding protein